MHQRARVAWSNHYVLSCRTTSTHQITRKGEKARGGPGLTTAPTSELCLWLSPPTVKLRTHDTYYCITITNVCKATYFANRMKKVIGSQLLNLSRAAEHRDMDIKKRHKRQPSRRKVTRKTNRNQRAKTNEDEKDLKSKLKKAKRSQSKTKAHDKKGQL